jgi:hypothetical protein
LVSNSKSTIANAYDHSNAKNGKYSKEISALADISTHSISPNDYNAQTSDGSTRSQQGTKKSDGQLRPLSRQNNKYFCVIIISVEGLGLLFVLGLHEPTRYSQSLHPDTCNTSITKQ